MKRIDVIASAKCVDEGITGTVPVVIDVLRATSVMVTAFEHGAERIIPVLTPEEAFAVKDKMREDVLLGGERGAEKIPGFDLDNSPFSYMDGAVKGKTIVMTTTNGTSAIKAASHAGDVLIASFLNAKAVAEKLKDAERISLVCSGTDGNYTLEDGLSAGYLIDLIKKGDDVELTDLAHLVHSFYLVSENDLQKAASAAKHYKVLRSKGFGRDLDYCFSTDESNIVPVYSAGGIKKQA